MESKKYIVLPRRGFKSPEMRTFASKGTKPSSTGRGDVQKLSVRPFAGAGPNFTVDVLESVAPDGPKVVTMSTLEAQEFRRQGSFRLAPVRKYHTARRPLAAISLKALSTLFTKSKPKTQYKLVLTEKGTDRPLKDVAIIAVIDTKTNAGIRRRTGESGQATLTIPEGAVIERFFIYPPPGFWGLYAANFNIPVDGRMQLSPIDVGYMDFRRECYKPDNKRSGAGVRVGVIDTGVDRKHPDLTVSKSVNCVPSEDSNDLNPTDGHGTHVAGIIAGARHGIAPNVELYSYKVFPHQGTAENPNISDAINRAVADKCDLVNLSLACAQPDLAISEAIGYAFDNGVVCIAAAGNARRNPVSYPAWFKRCLAVAAIGKLGTFPADAVELGDLSPDRSSRDKNVFVAAFSNHGREIDACAPGVGVVSTWVGGGYAAENGTSMACPVLTGVGAALLSADKSLQEMPRDIRRSQAIMAKILATCADIGLDSMFQGFGQPNL